MTCSSERIDEAVLRIDQIMILAEKVGEAYYLMNMSEKEKSRMKEELSSLKRLVGAVWIWQSRYEGRTGWRGKERWERYREPLLDAIEHAGVSEQDLFDSEELLEEIRESFEDATGG